jgi:hypothetical protein
VIAPQDGRFRLSASFASRTESSRSEGLNRERYPLKQMFTGVVPGLLYAQSVVEVIVAATTVVVTGLTALNAAHGGLVLGRLARHIAQRHAHLGLGFWLPAFGSLADLRDWFGAWGSVLGSRDPAVGRDPAGRAARRDPLPLRGPDVPDVGDGGVGHRAEPGLIHALGEEIY